MKCTFLNSGFEQIPSKVAGLVPWGSSQNEFNNNQVPKIDGRAITKMTKYCLVASEEALTMANWKPESEWDKERTGYLMLEMLNWFCWAYII